MPRGLTTARKFSCVLLTLAALPVSAQEILHLNISSRPLYQALATLGEQSGVNILYNAEPLESWEYRRSMPVRGRFTLDAALSLLLKDTELSFEMIDPTTAIVHRTEARKAPRFVRSQLPGRPDTEVKIVPEVVVVGTQIRGLHPESLPFLDFYDRLEIERSGASSTAEFLSNMSPSFAQMRADSVLNSGSSLVAASNRGRGEGLNLRGLGPGATLVLLDGQRLASGGSYGSFVDVSMIPMGAVERIEVLKDGSSAVYGSDAIAGTVNIVTRKNYKGAETSFRYGDSSAGGASAVNVSQVMGHSWRTGNATAIYEYDQQAMLDATERAFIPGQNGEFTVWPPQRRHSMAGSVQKTLSATTHALGTVLYSQRAFMQDSTFESFATQAEGVVRQFRLASTLSRDLPRDWQLSLSSHYSRHEERGVNLSEVGSDDERSVSIFSSRAASSAVELLTDGTLWPTPAGNIKLLIGSSIRREAFDDWSQESSAGTGLRRTSWSLFGELSIPVFGRMNEAPWMRKLELSLAARADNYLRTNYGAAGSSSLDPRIGVAWAPTDGLLIRSTYSTSFRAAPLSQSSEAGNALVPVALLDSNEHEDRQMGLLVLGGSHGLRPEQGRAFTIQTELKSSRNPWADASMSLGYFHVAYTDRISTPLTDATPTGLLLQYPVLAPYITLKPSEAQVREWLNSGYKLYDSMGIDAAAISAVFDQRWRNISSTTTDGLDFSAHYTIDTARSKLSMDLDAEYLFSLRHRAVPAMTPVELSDTVFNPPDFQLRGRMSLQRRPYSVSAALTYIDGYRDNLVSPQRKVGSWLTTDLQLGAELRRDAEESWLLTLRVKNVFDRNPPAVSSVASVLGYNPTQSSPFGRYVTVQLTKRW